MIKYSYVHTVIFVIAFYLLWKNYKYFIVSIENMNLHKGLEKSNIMKFIVRLLFMEGDMKTTLKTTLLHLPK